MEKIKFLFQQTIMITFGIVVVMATEGIVYRENVDFRWFHPLSIVLAGIICSLPSLILWSEKELSRAKYNCRIILHFASLLVIVMILGKGFNWYSHWDGAFFLAAGFIFVYAFVWGASTWIGSVDGKDINDALDHIRDEE